MKKFLLFMIVLAACEAQAKVDLVTLPVRDRVQLTIYNSADLTLVRENRALTLVGGLNKLQFSWATTLIDPTSLEMRPLENAGDIDIMALTYPPRTVNLGLWNIKSARGGKVPVEIDYLTSGLSWRAFYMGTLTEDEKTMRLEGYVRATNNSGEDYADAETRLIVGEINLIDQIRMLAQRQYPYDRPSQYPVSPMVMKGLFAGRAGGKELEVLEEAVAYDSFAAEMPETKEIAKEGLSEYFLYTIPGTETIPNGWSKRLPSFDTNGIPVLNLYKYEEERYGKGVLRFLNFKNDTEHKLGETPIPGGMLKVFRTTDEDGHLAYEGQSDFKYIPVNEDVELNLGYVGDVVVEPKLMDYKTDRFSFDSHGNIDGWDEISTWKVEIKNTRDLPVKVEITRNTGMPNWDIERRDSVGKYEKVDLDSMKFTVEPEPRSNVEFTYVLTKHFGRRAE
ncbi:MAG: hypothetical protein PHD86_06225 [Kiritimatiellae bacterium]|nr:hypothetical protein [Kiritimatiellia bacterium]